MVRNPIAWARLAHVIGFTPAVHAELCLRHAWSISELFRWIKTLQDFEAAASFRSSFGCLYFCCALNWLLQISGRSKQFKLLVVIINLK